jgi:hypothetical protein
MGPCDVPLSRKVSGRSITVARGTSVTIQWPRNNHAGGFIRFAWALTSNLIITPHSIHTFNRSTVTKSEDVDLTMLPILTEEIAVLLTVLLGLANQRFKFPSI